MTQMHNLLKRQLKKYFGDSFSIPTEWQKFVGAVNSAYIQADADRSMLERSIDLSSQELLQANSEMRALIQAFPDILFRIDSNGIILDFRTGSKTDLYLPFINLMGKRVQDIPIHEVSNKFQESIHKVQATQAMESIEYSLMIKEHHYYYEARLLPLLGDQIMIIVRNITDRKRIEEALRESEEKYRSLVEHVNVGICRITGGLHSLFLQINPSMLKIFGYDSIDEFMKLSFSDLFQNPEERTFFFEEVSQKGFLKDKELVLKKKDGTPIWISVIANAQYDESGNLQWIDGVIEDITERKKLEEQLLQAHKMEAIGTLAGGIAHDFNNILTVIMGYGTILKNAMKHDGFLRDSINELLSSAEKAAHLTQSLLAFSRKQIINPKPVDINQIIKKVKALLLRVLGEDIELKTVLTSDHLIVMADTSQIEQILINLAANARDSMPDGGTLIIKTNPIGLDDEFIKTHGYGSTGFYAAISISDTGHGFDERTKARIFEPFFTTRELGKGTGLGLSMVYGIVKQHDGYITVYSELYKGTTFRIYLPLMKTEVKETALLSPSTPSKGGSETVLLAEDDGGVRSIMKKILEEAGYKVIEAVDGEDAINTFLANKDTVQLLIFDVIMPKKSGKEAYHQIKKIRPEIKSLFLSGYTADIILRKGVLEEGLHFISKPAPPDKFLKTIREILDK
jgi:PAS domain S-box-containing protein